MAKKKGRPPASPSSSSQKQSSGVPLSAIDPLLDLSLIEEEDLALIDNLSAKQAEQLINSLDIIRAKIKGKSVEGPAQQKTIRSEVNTGINMPQSNPGVSNPNSSMTTNVTVNPNMARSASVWASFDISKLRNSDSTMEVVKAISTDKGQIEMDADQNSQRDQEKDCSNPPSGSSVLIGEDLGAVEKRYV
ncbi:hypothetical protein RIF29_19884 [Crotalaria pallida]|uniref:Uncharacterized protein n=1 Tax=Crotalaria pallida TaxID=3830 RepID=A0AAN9I6Y1_CROPI